MKDYEFYYLQILICNTFSVEKTFQNVVFIRSKFNGLEEVKKLRKAIPKRTRKIFFRILSKIIISLCLLH